MRFLLTCLNLTGPETVSGQGPVARRMAAALMACALLVTAGCATTSTEMANSNAAEVTALPTEVESGPYLIQAGDEISIRFYLTPELDEDIRIPPDGMLSLRLIGPIKATDKTTEELSEELQNEYKRELKSPDIAVMLRKTQSNQVFVGGEVQRPQAVQYTPNMTPIEAVLNAGGFKQSAKLAHVLIIRKDENGKPVPYEVDLKRMLAGSVESIPIQPLDIVYVPKTQIARVNQLLDKILRTSDVGSYGTVGELVHFEMLRSRRYHRPLCVFSIVVSQAEDALENETIRELRENTRRIDLVEVSGADNGVIHIVCPETNASQAVGLLNRDGSSIDLLLETSRERAVSEQSTW